MAVSHWLAGCADQSDQEEQSEMSHKSVENLRRETETRERKLEEGRHGKKNKFQLWFYSSSSRDLQKFYWQEFML